MGETVYLVYNVKRCNKTDINKKPEGAITVIKERKIRLIALMLIVALAVGQVQNNMFFVSATEMEKKLH